MQRPPLRGPGRTELGVLCPLSRRCRRRHHHGLRLDVDLDLGVILHHRFLDGGGAVDVLHVGGLLGRRRAVNGLDRAELSRGGVHGAHPLRSGRNPHDGSAHRACGGRRSGTDPTAGGLGAPRGPRLPVGGDVGSTGGGCGDGGDSGGGAHGLDRRGGGLRGGARVVLSHRLETLPVVVGAGGGLLGLSVTAHLDGALRLIVLWALRFVRLGDGATFKTVLE